MKQNLLMSTNSNMNTNISENSPTKSRMKSRTSTMTPNRNLDKSRSREYRDQRNLIDLSNSPSVRTLRKSDGSLHERLFNQAKELKQKLETKKSEMDENFRKKSVPQIHETSKKIERNQDLFSERLYPYHKLNKLDSDSDISFEYAHVATVRSNPLGISGEFDNEDFRNNIDGIFCDDEEIRNLYGNKPSYVKIYRGIKYPKKEKFTFKPTLSKNTQEIMKNLASSSQERIYKKCLSSSLDEINCNKKIVNEKIAENLNKECAFQKTKKKEIDYFNNPPEIKNNRYANELKKSYTSNYYMMDKIKKEKINQNSINISNNLYQKGINLLKKKEKVIEEKKKIDTEQLKKSNIKHNLNSTGSTNIINNTNNTNLIFFNSNNSTINFVSNNNLCRSASSNFASNNINSNIVILSKTKNLNCSSEDYKTQNYSFNSSNLNSISMTPGDSKFKKMKSENIKFDKSEIMDLHSSFGSSFYDKCKKWKDNKEAKNNKIRDDKSLDELKKCSFSPKILKKNIISNEEKSKNKVIGQNNDYVKRRLNSINKMEQEKNYQSKIFGENVKNLKMKITKPQEFNFSQMVSRKCRENLNNAKILHRTESVKDYREKLSTKIFFNQAVFEIEENMENNQDFAQSKSKNMNINLNVNIMMKK